MKIAFVSQPFDVTLPPCLNSVGYYTWGITRALQPLHSVAVYACGQTHRKSDVVHRDAGLSASPFDLRLIEATPRDLALFRMRTELGSLCDIWEPLSTWAWLYPDYGRRVAIDLARERWDVIHIHHCSQYAPVIRKHNPGVRIVLQLHAELFSQSDFTELSSRLESVDLLLGVSNHIARKSTRDFPELARRCRTMYYGVDPQEFAREKDYAAQSNRKQKRILFAGAISPQKGPHVLVDAFKIVAKSFPNVHLEFAGGQQAYPIEESFDVRDWETVRAVKQYYQKTPLRHIAHRLGLIKHSTDPYSQWLWDQLEPELAEKVSFSGHIEERAPLVDRYYDADIFVFPPVWDEGFGIPPVEAMAAGTPVVGSRSGGLMETIEDGVTGFLVEKNDPRGLAERILQLLNDAGLRERIGRAARERILSQFTWPIIAEQMTGIYSETLTSLVRQPRSPGTDEGPEHQWIAAKVS